MNSRGVVLLGCLTFVAAVVSFGNAQPAEAPPGAVTAPASAPVAAKFRNEEHWIMDSIARDVSDMLLFAKHAAAGTGENPAGQPSDDKMAVHVKRTAHVWSPENFMPIAKTLIDGWKIQVPEQKTAADARLPQRLLAASLKELIVESRRVAEDLTQHPLDAELHERAALIIGAFGLREAAGTFADTRPALCRMSAHLSVARVLREKPEVCGQIAEAILLCLANRQAETLEKIALFPKEQSAWVAALKTRVTGDWRTVATPEKATFVEQAEHARALAKCVNAAAVRDFLGKMNAQQQAEWSRIVMEQRFGVEDGHIFAKGSIVLELEELRQDWEAWSGRKLDEAKIVEAVNVRAMHCVVKAADGKPRIEVLGWGDFAAFHQRHICHSIEHTIYFLRRLWGVPDMAKQFEEAMEKKLSGMRLYPFVTLSGTVDAAQRERAATDATNLCSAQPELITASSRERLWMTGITSEQGTRRSESLRWFAPPLLAETAYDIQNRYRVMPVVQSLGPAYLEQLRAIAPYEIDVLREVGRRKFGPNPTVQQMKETLASISDYDIGAMWQIASLCKEDPKEYLTHMRKACELNPNLYLSLGRYLLDKQMPKEASYAYQAAFERANDRVGMANESAWIVNYYYENGRVDDALKIASHAAEVYSHRGLETMAQLMERMGKLDEAEKYFRNILERYDDTGSLLAFYMRHKDEKPKFVESIKQITAVVFPNGMKKVAIADFSAAPTDGVVVDSTNANTERAGIKRGDIFVALDGYRVETLEQYMLVRGLTEDPKLTLIVWNGTKYVEISTSLPQRRFGNQISTYQSNKR